MSPSRELIAKVWDYLPTLPEHPISLRALWPKGVPEKQHPKNYTYSATAYPNVIDRQRALEAKAFELNAQGFNTYIVMNVIDPSFLGDEENRVAVRDEHIACRRHLLIDLDREETAEPATDDELVQIVELATAIRKKLRRAYGHEVLGVFSGNGMHLYLPLDDLPNTPENRELCQRMLLALAQEFDTDTVKVDTSVYNASRITKLPGTIARKGLESEGRPYRLATVQG